MVQPLTPQNIRVILHIEQRKNYRLNSKHPCPETYCYLPGRAYRLNIPLRKAAKDQILEEKVNEYFKS